MKFTPDKWQLLRCRYDSMGMAVNEFCDPDRIDRMDSWFIGVPFMYNDKRNCHVVLEGTKETLEYVMELIRK